jgi:uncharacterized protein YfaS (alpha-2-macroglobulin family)
MMIIQLLLVFLLSYAMASASESTAPSLSHFTPQGTVKKVRQVTTRFSQPMVPFGDPRSVSSPFEINCSEKGTQRWIDSRNWVYDFNRDLPAGIQCTFRLRADLMALDGTPVSGLNEFVFSTGGPAIRSSRPYDGSKSIDEEQAFAVVLDADATEESILSHVWFSIEGIQERVGINMLTGETHETLLKTLPRWLTSQGPVLLFQAKQHFPHGAKVNLVWGAGVTAKSGIPTEQDQTLAFQTRKAFAATFHCERVNKKAGCLPVKSMEVSFSAPVSREQAQQITLMSQNGAENQRHSPQKTEDKDPFVSRVQFPGPFPEKTAFRIELPIDLRDDAGRPLSNADRYPLTVQTGPFPPLAKFSARFGILESQADPTLPVTLRNLEPEIQAKLLPIATDNRTTGKITRIAPVQSAQLLPWLRRVAMAKRDTSVFDLHPNKRTVRSFSLPKPHGAQPLEVVGIPLENPGLYIVELESRLLGKALMDKPQPMYVPTAALVTNLSIHFKWGRENSLVWVTALDTAQPVAAHVVVQDCRGSVVWQGGTNEQGIARIDRLPTQDALPNCPWPKKAFQDFFDYSQIQALRSLTDGLFVTAHTADDLSFVHSSWDDGIERWRFQLPSEDYWGPAFAHTIFDRSLFRAGDTVHMKHLMRVRTMHGFSHLPAEERPSRVVIQHQGSFEEYALPLEWDAAGFAENSWHIPPAAKLGQYTVSLHRPKKEQKGQTSPSSVSEHSWSSGSFRVEEFRIPLMKGIVQFPATPQVAPIEIPVDLSLHYLAGGGASHQSVTLRSQLRSKSMPSFPDFEGFWFANGQLEEGLVRRHQTSQATAGTLAPAESLARGKPVVLQRQALQLDAAGSTRAKLSNLPTFPKPLELLAELEFRDPNGEVQTVSSTTPIWPAEWLVGLKPDSWAASKDSLKIHAAVVDVSGKAVPNALVQVDLFRRNAYSHRKRLVGGFYAYEHVEEITRIGAFCQGQTNAQGLLICEGTSPIDGNIVLQASLTTPSGQVTTAQREIWVAGSERWWFTVQDNDRIDLLPEKKRYEPGETARLQVRMPFAEATALVSVEREGILEASVVSLSGQEPTIEVPISGQYAPNIFVSVLVVRGRVGDVQPTARVDLGKPAFKLGITELHVGWQAHQLKVSLTPDRSVYQVREEAAVSIRVHSADGTPLAPGSEVAVAAVDAGLLELLPNTSWDVLRAVMGRRGYGVRTATAQMQVVGKRHYGLKALPQGGGGGQQATRELFDTLLFWKGQIALDDNGEAVVRIPLNDSLTSFRIVAVATSGVGQFGTGETTIRSTQDLMLLSGIPPLVREGDQLRAESTLRNTTDRAMTVTVTGQMDGPDTLLARQTVSLAPGEARGVGWDITVPTGVTQLQYTLAAEEQVSVSDQPVARDQIQISQEVTPAVKIRTFQATLQRWEKPIQQSVRLPMGAIPGRGGVQVVLRPSLANGLDSVRDWMADYPYTCLEQQVSQAVALRETQRWQEIVAKLPSYMDAEGLCKYFPTMSLGSPILTSYLLALSDEAGWSVPDEIQTRMISGLSRFVEGNIVRHSSLPTADLVIRKLSAIEALARLGKAAPRMLGSITIDPNLWPTSAVLDWWSILQRVDTIPDRKARLKEAEQIIRSRLDLRGTTMGFSTEGTDRLWWLMGSIDTNAVRLLLQVLPLDQWREDIPRLIRGALGRQQNGVWDLTVANAWGTLAVEKFSQTFEATPLSGTTTARIAANEQQVTWPNDQPDNSLQFAWPQRKTDLTIDHTGTGNPWVTFQANAAIPLQKPLTSGYRITKTFTPIDPKDPDRFSRGDRIRVRLEIDAQRDMTWVVVNDPIPAGASHLGTGLGRDSQLATQGEQQEGWAWPAFEERSFEAFRAYYEFVAKGQFVLEYTIRLNQSGRFKLPTTRVEALYAPEIFGELPNDTLVVEP